MSLATMSKVPPEGKATRQQPSAGYCRRMRWPALNGTIAQKAEIDAGLGVRPACLRARAMLKFGVSRDIA